MPRFRRRRGGGARRARSFVRRTVANMGPIESKRIIYDNETIAAITSTSYDTVTNFPLIKAQESVDEEVEAIDSSTPTQVRPYSKIVGLKGRFTVHNFTANDRIRWMLYKDEDGDVAANITTLVDSTFHGSDDTTAKREIRAKTLAKGVIVGNSDRNTAALQLFVKRKTLHRLGSLRENDQLILAIASSGAAAKLTGFGTIYVRHN